LLFGHTSMIKRRLRYLRQTRRTTPHLPHPSSQAKWRLPY